MRIIVFVLAAALVFGWLGFELRHRNRALSQASFAFCVILLVLLVGAVFGLYG